MHRALLGGERLGGLTRRGEIGIGAAGATNEIGGAADEPFNVAVTVTDWFETSVPVLAVNVAEAALAATLTEDGMVRRVEALLESATTVLLVVDFDRVTVQGVLALEGRLGGSEGRRGGEEGRSRGA